MGPPSLWSLCLGKAPEQDLVGARATGEGAGRQTRRERLIPDGFFGLRQSELGFCPSATRSPDS